MEYDEMKRTIYRVRCDGGHTGIDARRGCYGSGHWTPDGKREAREAALVDGWRLFKHEGRTLIACPAHAESMIEAGIMEPAEED